MKELLTKINNAKSEIKDTKVKKHGHNDFSNYDYFTPDQIEQLVSSACKNNGLLTTFDLIRNELGIYGVLTIYDLESGKDIKLNMATEIPQIKATNTAQQLGGCVTYTERYLKMSAFGITDNSLDFDNNKNETYDQKVERKQREVNPDAWYYQELDKLDDIIKNANLDHDDLASPMKCDWATLYQAKGKQNQKDIITYLENSIENTKENK